MSHPDRTELTRDQIFDILSNQRRRYILLYLSRQDTGATVQELSEQIAMWENDVTAEELSDKQRKRVYVSLYQTHIPKLDESGIIDYDEETGDITLTTQARSVQAYLQEEEEGLDPWPIVYFTLVALGMLIFTATTMNVGVFGQLPDFVVGVGILLAFGLVTLAYVIAREQSLESLRTRLFAPRE